MKLLITGGRTNFDVATIHITLYRIHARTPISLLIHGAAPGCDTICANWAISNGITVLPFPANWQDFSEPCLIREKNGRKYNALEGSKRNERMIVEGKPHIYFAFVGGSGTADMIKRCKRYKILNAFDAPPTLLFF